MDQIETMKVKSSDARSQGDFVLINREDFNPDIHEPYNEQSLKELTVAQIRALLVEKKIDIPSGSITKAELLALLEKANSTPTE